MILKLTIANFLSFKEKRIFDFTDINGNSQNLFSVIGKNASGKSNFIKALSLIKNNITNSYANKPDSLLIPFPNKFFPFEASEFEIEFKIDDSIYKYMINQDFFINYEALYKDDIKIFELKHETDTEIDKNSLYKKLMKAEEINYTYNFRQLFRSDIENSPIQKYAEFIRPNASIISILKHLNVGKFEDFDKVYEYFNKFIISHGTNTNVQQLLHNNVIGKMMDNHVEYKEYMLKHLKLVDSEVDDIRIQPIEGFTNSFEVDMRESEKVISSSKKVMLDELIVTKDNEDFKIGELSEGTLKAIYYSNLLFNSNKNGSIIVIDEIEIGLHPTLLKSILQDVPKKSQLIFTTHSLLVLDFMNFQGIGITEMINHQTEVVLLKNEEHQEEEQFQIMRRYLSGEYEKKEFSLNMSIFE